MVDGTPTTPADPRKERAKETRKRMVHAATRLFAERGFAQTPMTAIAQEADVAVQTLYFTFHTKKALLLEAHDYAVTADDPTEWPRREWMEALIAEPDPRQALRLQAELNVEVYKRIGPVLRAIEAVAGDPEIADFVANREQLRVDGFAMFIDLLAAKGAGLKQGLSRERARDILLMVHGPGAIRFLVDERGWSSEEWRDWSVEALAAMLLA